MSIVTRSAYLLAAVACLGLALLGLVVPLLPTTPLVLLGSFFLVRCSPAWAERLRSLPVIGDLLRDWEQQRAVRPRTKRVVYGLVSVTCVLNLYWLGWTSPIALILLSLGVVGLMVVWRLPMASDQHGTAIRPRPALPKDAQPHGWSTPHRRVIGGDPSNDFVGRS